MKNNPKYLPRESPYECFYCGRDDQPLVQLGEEASTEEEWDSGERRVSPEDANAVEICLECLQMVVGEMIKNYQPKKR